MCANSICQIPPKYLDCFYIDCTFQALTSASVLAWSPSWMILVSRRALFFVADVKMMKFDTSNEIL